MDGYTTSSAAKLSSQDVGANEEEKEKLGLPQPQEGTTPSSTTRCLHLIEKVEKLKTELPLATAEAADKGREEKPVYMRISRCLHLVENIDKLKTELDKLKTELGLATAEAADEGEEEKPVYLRVSNYINGRFGYDWYMYDLVKKQRVKVFDRMEWEGGARHHRPAVVVVSASVIYVLGGAYPCPHQNGRGILYCRDVLYFDTKYPQDGWKVGPQLPSTHEHPFATSIHEKLCVFGVLDTVPSVLDTAVKGAGWKHLPELDGQPLMDSTAHPDPSRDRILLFTCSDGLLAYSLPEKKWEHIDPNFGTHSTSIVLEDVLYYASCRDVMCAYDLVHCQQLTVVYHNLTEYGLSRYIMKWDEWDHLLHLGCGKLCFVKFYRSSKNHEAFFLKLKVEKETGENKVHVTLLSAQGLKMEGDDCYEGALTL